LGDVVLARGAEEKKRTKKGHLRKENTDEVKKRKGRAQKGGIEFGKEQSKNIAIRKSSVDGSERKVGLGQERDLGELKSLEGKKGRNTISSKSGRGDGVFAVKRKETMRKTFSQN